MNPLLSLKRSLQGISLVLLLWMPQSLGAQGSWTRLSSEQQTAIQKKLAQANQQMKTMTCDFRQEKKMEMLEKEMVSKGRLQFKAPDKLRWEYLTPYAYVMVMNGSQVAIRNPNKTSKGVTNNPKMFREISDIMMRSVQGNAFVDPKMFGVSYWVQGTKIRMDMKPLSRKLKSLFAEIRIYMEADGQAVYRVDLIEVSGDSTELHFTNRQVNKDLKDTLFQ